MTRWLGRFLTETNWLFVGTVGLALFQLAPLFQTGYLADDAGNSLVRGIRRYYDINIFQLIYRDVVAWLAQARFYPLASVHIYLIFYLIPTLALYKSFVIILILSNLALFRLLARRMCTIGGFPELCMLLTLMLFQFRIYHDPILAFGGLLQFAFLYVLVSLYSLCKYLESNHPAWLIASVGTYLLALLTYEITYPMFFLHMLFMTLYTRSMYRILRIGMLFLGSAALCASVCIFLRMILGITADAGYRPNSDLVAYLTTLSKQLFAGLPLSYSLTSGRESVPALSHLRHAWPAMVELILAIILCFTAIRQISGARSDERPFATRRAFAIALAFVILPPLLTCLSPRYQREIFWGVAQMPVYIEYYGFGLLFAPIIAFGALRLRFHPRTLGVFALLVSVAAASVLSFTGYFNHTIAKKWAGGWYTEREDIERALAAGLADAVPEGATLIPGHRYPWWHDDFGAYFYCQNCGKKLHFPASLQKGPGIPLIQSGTSGNQERLPSSSGCYGLYDYRIDSRFGYVFLCELGEGSAGTNGSSASRETRKGWLFVRTLHPNAERFEIAFRIVAPGSGGIGSVRPQECKLVREEKDWRLYNFETNDWCVDAQSLRVEILAGGNRY